MDPQAWVWRSIGLAVVVVAAVVALWFMGQVGGAVGGVTFATPAASITASPTPTRRSPARPPRPSGSGLAAPHRRPTPSNAEPRWRGAPGARRPAQTYCS